MRPERIREWHDRLAQVVFLGGCLHCMHLGAVVKCLQAADGFLQVLAVRALAHFAGEDLPSSWCFSEQVDSRTVVYAMNKRVVSLQFFVILNLCVNHRIHDAT